MATNTCTPTNIITISNTKHISTPLFSIQSRVFATRNRSSISKISCKSVENNDQSSSMTNNDCNSIITNNNNSKFDRRNLLIGLGGLYGATANLTVAPKTLASPLKTSDLASCGPAFNGLNCCPPKATTIVDFVVPPIPNTLRVRPAAHLVDDQYKEKFFKAISLMKALPSSDPRSFIQQANVHCAYCNGGHNQLGFSNLDMQVHGSWIFLPFHRLYLYFFERILGKLIDDPTFALPFWNWDSPAGMQMPAMYTDSSSPLYDSFRNADHVSRVVDLNYDGRDDSNVTDDDIVAANLMVIYRQMVSNSRTTKLFMGQPFRAGDNPNPGSGSIENVPHGPVHIWAGDPNQPNGEDMGTFYAAARDPIFYAHHCNIDRMWFLWKTLGVNRKNFTDPDWLNASFIFYDENAQAVRVSVKDCLETKSLGYTYQNVDLAWVNARPTPRPSKVKKSLFSSTPKIANAKEKSSTIIKFPRILDSVLRIDVARPRKSRSKKEKEHEEEVLVINIEANKDVYIKFDVYVNDEDDVPTKKTQIRTEYAGSFVNVPHKHKHGTHSKMMKTTFRLGLTEIIEDLGADDDEGVTVTLIPRSGKKNNAIIIKSMKIELSS